MTDSVHAHIVFGVQLQTKYGEAVDPPWRDVSEVIDINGVVRKPPYGAPQFQDIDEWWRAVNGFEQKFQIFDATGNYPGGVKPSRADEERYFDERRTFAQQCPKPFEHWNAGCDQHTYTILGVPDSGHIAGRYEPSGFDPSKLSVTPEAVAALKQFLERFDIKEEPGWLLFCYTPTGY